MEAKYFARDNAGRCFIRGTVPALVDTQGRTVEREKPALFAEFVRGAPIWGVNQLPDSFGWDRMPDGWTPGGWLPWYDSESAQRQHGWSDEERKLIEDTIGDFPGVYPIEVPRASTPYGKYKTHRKVTAKRTVEHVLADIGSAIDAAGVSPQAVIDYEMDHPDSLSDQIIASMTALLGTLGKDEDEELVEA